MPDDLCPDCGCILAYDEVDIGVGYERGNVHCPNCGWEPKRLDEIDDRCTARTDIFGRCKLEVGHVGRHMNALDETFSTLSKCDGNHAGPRCADPECWN